jgi:hypothetical protein
MSRLFDALRDAGVVREVLTLAQGDVPAEHPAHRGHEFGGGYARAMALAEGDPDWMNARGGDVQEPTAAAVIRQVLAIVCSQRRVGIGAGTAPGSMTYASMWRYPKEGPSIAREIREHFGAQYDEEQRRGN